MINGPAVGSGMDMALHCDIRVGCEKTRFIGYHNAGQIIENGGSYYLPKMVGLGRALEFAYTGELNAERAYEWGMLNHLVPSEKLEETTRELCERIIAMPPLVQWVSKRIMRAALDSTLETTMVLTSNAGGILQGSEDAKEATARVRREAQRPLQGRLIPRSIGCFQGQQHEECSKPMLAHIVLRNVSQASSQVPSRSVAHGSHTRIRMSERRGQAVPAPGAILSSSRPGARFAVASVTDGYRLEQCGRAPAVPNPEGSG